MANISVYLNDIASGSDNQKWKEQINNYLFRHNVQFKTPQGISDLRAQLGQEKDQETEYVFAVGGDGTANTIIPHILNTDIKLMVIPTGTANDFASELGLNSNIKKLVKIFQHKTFSKVDVVRINDQHMITNGGIGLSANVAEAINSARRDFPRFKKVMKMLGSSVYSLFFAKEIFSSLRSFKFHIESADFPELNPIVDASMIMINNQPKIGGKFLVAPHTLNNDGKVNVTIFKHQKRADLMNCSLKMLQGKYPKNDPNIISFETNKLSLTHIASEGDNGDMAYFGDGEILDKSKTFEIDVLQRALNVCTFNEDLLYCNSYSLDNIDLI